MAGHTELGWDILAGIHGVLFNMEEALFHWSLHIKKKVAALDEFSLAGLQDQRIGFDLSSTTV